MGLFDSFKTLVGGVLGEAEQQALAGGLSSALAGTQLGSLDGLLDKLRQSGLGPQVQSWLGGGPNQPITADQLEAALGPAIVDKISSTMHLPPDQVFGFLAAHLPALIDRLSPNGSVQQPTG
jgi:uncharacterized protein YidB (DUF937 family)